MSDSQTDDRRHVVELVKNAKAAMLTTMTADRKHVSRPMGLQEAEVDGDLWFFASEDSAKVAELSTPVLKAWFPDGLETPGLTLIKVEADTAEYWDAPTSTVALVAGNLRAAVTGNPKKDPINNDTVEL